MGGQLHLNWLFLQCQSNSSLSKRIYKTQGFPINTFNGKSQKAHPNMAYIVGFSQGKKHHLKHDFVSNTLGPTFEQEILQVFRVLLCSA